MKRTAIALLTLAALLAACHDDTDEPTPPTPATPGAWTVSVVGGTAADTGDDDAPALGWRAAYESLTVSISGRTAATGTIAVTIDEGSDWLSVASDTLAADSIVALTTKTNDTGMRRDALPTSPGAWPDGVAPGTAADVPGASPSGTPRATLRIVQLSQADNSHNGDPREQLYIGYGYDIYKALESPMAVRTKAPVLNYERLREMTDRYGTAYVQDCHLAQTGVRYVASNSIHAFGRDLAEQQTGDTDNHFEGCSEDCKQAEQLIDKAKGELTQHNFGHGSLEKAVASRIIDRAALIDMQRKNTIPFTNEVIKRFNDLLLVITDPAQRRQYIEQMLTDFGTHVIIQVDLGGRIDYTFTMQKSASFNSVEEMKQEVDFTLGRIADTDRTGKNRTPSSSKSHEGAITVTGGSTDLRSQLESDIRALDGSGQISPTHLANWLASINYSQNFERDASLDIIHFELIPLWDLVPSSLRQEFMEATFRMAQRSDSQLPASFTGTDIYQIDTSEKALFDFSDIDNIGNIESLSRLLYIDGDPVLEVCSEYVPKIRTDQRVTIAYPIYRQHIRMNQGLFLGDGIHQPAYVGFSGADCYVDPIDSLAPGRRISRFYYASGSLLVAKPIAINEKGVRTVEDDLFRFVSEGQTVTTPILKLGAQFWTRRDINYAMGFSRNPTSKKTNTDEHVVDGVLYARFYRDLGYYPQQYNGWMWGWKPNTFYESQPNTRWYLPSPDDVRNLYAFLGFNPKALFPGQVSGFGAQFNGYYGIHDFLQNRSFDDGDNAVRYRGQLSVLATRHAEDTDNPLFAILDQHYRLTLREATGDFHRDYFPVRAVRGFMFEYPTLNIIKDNIYK